MQRNLFVYQKDLFVRCEKNFQGEIAIRSRNIAIKKKVPLECSEDRVTHLLDLNPGHTGVDLRHPCPHYIIFSSQIADRS